VYPKRVVQGDKTHRRLHFKRNAEEAVESTESPAGKAKRGKGRISVKVKFTLQRPRKKAETPRFAEKRGVRRKGG